MSRCDLRTLTTALATTAILATFASPIALAQEEGVTLDPSDPAAKEYALPHDEARRDASGEASGTVTQGGGGAAPFGEGVSRDSETETAAARGSKGAAAAGDAAAEREAPATTTGGATDTPGASDRPPAPTEAGGLNSTGALILGGGLALLVAGLGGFALRALRGPANG